jgi:2-methylcitrate dehydratase PrpD
VIHPYIDALLRLAKRHGFSAADVARIDCAVAQYIVPLVCEPIAEKIAPISDFHGRVSLQYTLAEALAKGGMGRGAYDAAALRDPAILKLASQVHYFVDPEFPGPGQFKGAVTVTLHDGRQWTEVEEYNRGSPQNPMTAAELHSKFEDNAGAVLDPQRRRALAETIGRLPELRDISQLISLAVP